MISKKVLVVAVASTALLSGIVAALGARAGSPYDWAAGLAGCHTSAPAVAHHGNQAVLNPQPTNGPVPCGMLTGWPTVENKIEVTNNNTLIYEPALQGGPVLSGDGHVPGWGREFGFAFSNSNGSTWNGSNVQVPMPDDYVLDSQVDNYIYVDHNTGRFFWYMMDSGTGHPKAGYDCGGGGGATVAFSGDNGKTWAFGNDFDHNCSENPNIITAKPTVSGEQLSYPNVVYLCGDNTSTGVATTGTLGYSCSKSLTGGASWLGTTYDAPANTLGLANAPQAFYAGKQKDAVDPYPQCAGQSSSAGADVQPLANGTLVVVVSCNNEFFLSESKDEGATWKITNQIPHGGELRIDSAANMYLVELLSATNGDSQLMLSHSTNGGATWSPEQNMVAPGVTSVGTWWFAQGTFAPDLVGDVAVAYYGVDPSNADGKNGYSDGYITATREALDANPVFWSGQVNNPGTPLLYNTTTDGNIGVTILDFNGSAWAPNGQSVWGSWVQDCGVNVATSPGCTTRYPHINPGNPDDGFAGRLVWRPGDESN